MKVKAQGFLNAAEYIQETYGRDSLAKVLRACSDDVREHYTSLIAIDWQELDELCEFIETAETILEQPAGKLAEAIGAAGARANLKGTLLRAAFYLGKPEYLMRRVAGIWRQFNDEGTMTVQDMTDHDVKLEVTGVTNPRASFCCVLTGWCFEMTRALGIKDGRATHIQCRARGGKRCLWEVRGRIVPRA